MHDTIHLAHGTVTTWLSAGWNRWHRHDWLYANWFACSSSHCLPLMFTSLVITKAKQWLDEPAPARPSTVIRVQAKLHTNLASA